MEFRTNGGRRTSFKGIEKFVEGCYAWSTSEKLAGRGEEFPLRNTEGNAVHGAVVAEVFNEMVDLEVVVFAHRLMPSKPLCRRLS